MDKWNGNGVADEKLFINASDLPPYPLVDINNHTVPRGCARATLMRELSSYLLCALCRLYNITIAKAVSARPIRNKLRDVFGFCWTEWDGVARRGTASEATRAHRRIGHASPCVRS